MPVVRRAVAALLSAALVSLAAAGCTGEDDPSPAPATPTPSTLGELATDLPVARAGFCPRVAPGAVEDALGSAPADSSTWQNGDSVTVTEGVQDVVHEYGCSWTGADGVAAKAWVFAPPVTRAEAASLRRTAARADGCRPIADAARFGDPSTAVACRAGTTVTSAYHGLFGDAWLSCSLSGATEVAAERLDAWCASVAQAAGD